MSSGPNFVVEFRLRAQFELRLLSSNFVFIVLGIRASGGHEMGTRCTVSMQTSIIPAGIPNSRARLLMFSLGKQTSVGLGRRVYSLQELIPVALMVVLAVLVMVLVYRCLKAKTVKIRL